MKEQQVLGSCSREHKFVNQVCIGLNYQWNLCHLSESRKVWGSCFNFFHCLRMEESRKMCLHHGRQGEMASKPECVANWWRRWKWIWRTVGLSTAVSAVKCWWIDESHHFFGGQITGWRGRMLCAFVWSLWRNFHQMGCQETPISAGFGNPPRAEMIYRAWWHGYCVEVRLPSFLVLSFPEVPVSHCSNPGFGRRFVLLRGKGSKNLPTWIPTCFFFSTFFRIATLPSWNSEVVHSPNIPLNEPVGHLEAGSLCFPLLFLVTVRNSFCINVFSSQLILMNHPNFYESRTSLFWFSTQVCILNHQSPTIKKSSTLASIRVINDLIIDDDGGSFFNWTIINH